LAVPSLPAGVLASVADAAAVSTGGVVKLKQALSVQFKASVTVTHQAPEGILMDGVVAPVFHKYTSRHRNL
jgi:hypothetical protein